MINRIHILGASGSGTTTLANELSKRLNYMHFDTDDYFWMKTDPPFQNKRCIQDRQILLKKDLEDNKKWVLSGSLCGWGDIFIPYFDLVIFLWIPKEIRISRLKAREKKRHGKKIELNGEIYKCYTDFIEWASKYDDGDMNIRSRELHDNWINELPCKVLRLEGLLNLEEKIKSVMDILNTKDD